MSDRASSNAVMLDASLDLAARGWSVLPLHSIADGACTCGKADCARAGKHPRTKSGVKDATSDHQKIREWWARWPSANLGVATGRPSGVVVLDVDPRHGGDESLAALEREHGPLPATLWSRTGSGGRHFVFVRPDSDVRNAVGVRPGLDVRADGGFVVAPPSLHASGERYEWQVPLGSAIAPPPKWLLDGLRGRRLDSAGGAGSPDAASANGSSPLVVPRGTRNNTYTSLAGGFRARGLSLEAALDAILRTNAEQDEPSPAEDVEEVVRGVYGRYSAGRVLLNPADPLQSAHEYGTRRRPTLMHHTDEWLAYDGAAYAPVEERTIRAELYDFLAAALQVGRKNEPPSPFRPTQRRVGDVVDALKGAAHVPGAKHEPPCWLASQPGDPPAAEVIACRNGILHLRTGRLLPSTPRLFTRNALSFDYDASAPRPERWLRFLGELWPADGGEKETLQEVLGYLLVPNTSQQKVFLLVGPRRSGKGTIARVLAELVGRPNVCAPSLNVLGDRFGLAPLIGKQLATVSDARIGSRTDQAAIAENLLRISGEDMVTVDRKYASAWHGRLAVRFVILTNELPRLADASAALASRFVPLELSQSFLGREDPGLTSALLAELPGILLWAIEGWRRLNERGHFDPPAAARDAVAALERLGSPVRVFVDERCELGAFDAPKRDVYRAYRTWCEEVGEHPRSAAVFGRDLIAAVRGVRAVNRTGGGGAREWRYDGIRLREVVDDLPY
ncbi:MAG: phage/plasmid primase, P4 family [bacterium]